MRFILGGKALTARIRFLKRVAWSVVILVLIFLGAAMAAERGRTEEVKLVPFADTFISSKHHERERSERSTNFGNKEKLEVVGGKPTGQETLADGKVP